jgi:hypothetical protein
LLSVITDFSTWLRYYATSQKVMGLNPDEVEFFSIDVILPATLWL